MLFRLETAKLLQLIPRRRANSRVLISSLQIQRCFVVEELMNMGTYINDVVSTAQRRIVFRLESKNIKCFNHVIASLSRHIISLTLMRV